MYDPATTRFIVVDPLYRLYYFQSPYVYGFNNPVRYIEIYGMGPGDRIWGSVTDFANGFANAVASNATTVDGPAGKTALVERQSGSESFSWGQKVGDAFSIAQGAIELAGGYIAATVGTVGGTATSPTVVGAAAGTAITAGGVLIAGHGANAAINGYKNLMSDNKGTVNASSSRAGKSFTPNEKQKVIEQNMKANNGDVVCEGCGVKTTVPKKSEKGVTPPKTDRQVDHIKPKSKGGSGTADNGQILCRDCNVKKSDKLPEEK